MDHVVGSFCGAAATITKLAAFAFTDMTAAALHNCSATGKNTNVHNKISPGHQLTTSGCVSTTSKLPLHYLYLHTLTGHVNRAAL